MKKLIALLLTGLLALSLAACDNSPATPTPTPGSSAPQGSAAPTPGGPQVEEGSRYTFLSGDVKLPMNAPFADLHTALGKEQTYFEAESCAFQGLDKTYSYPGFELTTYPIDGVDYISDIYFLDDSVATPEGIRIGSTFEEMVAAYGEDYVDSFGISYIYTDGDTQLIFTVDEGCVTEVEYLALHDYLN